MGRGLPRRGKARLCAFGMWRLGTSRRDRGLWGLGECPKERGLGVLVGGRRLLPLGQGLEALNRPFYDEVRGI